MSTGNLKAKFEQEIKGATPKDTDTLRENICKRGSIPTIGAAPTAKGALGQNPENGVICLKTLFDSFVRSAQQGISQLIQHQYRLDLVSARADRLGRTP